MSAHGISRLIAVTQMKANNANEDAADGADKQRDLIAQQRAVRGAQTKLEDAVRDGTWGSGDRAAMQNAWEGLGQAGIGNLGSVATVRSDTKLDASGNDAQKANNREVDAMRKALEGAMKDLEGQDRLGNFDIQDLMSQFNQAETLASSVLKKRDDTSNAVIGKVG